VIRIDNLVVADRADEYGVRYTQDDGVLLQEFFAACDSQLAAVSRAQTLSGQVVRRTIFTTSWETVTDE
jgi:hypothetical protein